MQGVWKSLAMAAVVAPMAFGQAQADNTITIGHFGNPTPFQVAVSDGSFESATGWSIDWRRFGSGTEVIAAMASGDIKLAELGSSPLAIAASQGVDLQLFLIAQGIGTAESLIVRNEAGIAAPADLAGKRVAVPVGSTAHFSLMGALTHWGIAETALTILNMPPDQIAAAWQQSAIDGAFIWQPVQAEILKTGTRMIDAGTIATWGFPTFDGWVVDRAFAAENPDFMTGFIQTMAAANQAYLDDPSAWTAESAPVQSIAAATGAAAEQVPQILDGFVFLPLEDQVSETWLGGTAPQAMKATAEFLQAAGRIDSARDDYGPFVNVDLANGAL